MKSKTLPARFKARLNIIGINPFVFVPANILAALFVKNGKDKGPIPVRGWVNEKPFQQTLVKFKGSWRFYVNTAMLPDSPKRIGELLTIEVDFDPDDRSLKPHPKLIKALNKYPEAKEKFKSLPPGRKKEFIRYLSYLKTEESVDRNVERMINHLLGKESFAGRKPN